MPPSKNTSKFAGMIPKTVPDEEAVAPSSADRKTRKVAKSTNKDFRITNFYVHIDTFADAAAKLRKERSGRDMSDLVNDLVAKWLKESAI